MKKFSLFMIGLLFAFVLGFSSCNGCKNKEADAVLVEDSALNVENLISMDRQDMFMNHGQDYRWYETCMKLNYFLDEENDGSLQEVVNVFQAISEAGDGYDTKVFKFQHFADGTYAQDSVIGFWVEDFPLNDEQIKLTYQEAYDKLMATNLPKPHSRYCTLRKQIGPKAANPQYVFGNLKTQVYVDAVTGEVTDVNPAFGPGTNFGTPLGEWP